MAGCDVPNPCSPDRQKVVRAAFIEAKAWLPHVQRQVAAYINAPGKKKSRPVAKALKKHFDWTEKIREQVTFSDAPRIVVAQINLLLTKIDIPPFNANCLSSGATGQPDLSEIAAEVQSDQIGTNCFSYAPAFFGKKTSPEGRIAIVIHEMLHSWAGMPRDIAYEGKRDYPPRVGNAVENPASFAGLIRDLRPR
jgi:hypothetical protein